MSTIRISRKNNATLVAHAAACLAKPLTYEVLHWACEALERDFFVSAEQAKRIINNRGANFDQVRTWAKQHIAHDSKMSARDEHITRNLLQAIVALDMIYEMSANVSMFDDSRS